MTSIDETLDHLGNSILFITLDLAGGYHRIEIDGRSQRENSVFYPHYPLLIPYNGVWIIEASSSFQRLMDNVLVGVRGIECLVYMDDVISLSETLQEHGKRFSTVFERHENGKVPNHYEIIPKFQN